MPAQTIIAGSTSQTIWLHGNDFTTGDGKTGLVYNTAGLIAWYERAASATTTITLATLATPTSAWATGGFKEMDATNAKGRYRLDVPNAAFATGVSLVTVGLQIAGTVFIEKEIELTRIPAPVYTTVATDAGNTAAQLKFDATFRLTGAGLLMVTGTYAGEFTKVASHVVGTGIATFRAFSGVPAAGDIAQIVNY